jgi:hypothetical protein
MFTSVESHPQDGLDNERREILRSLKGKQARIPDLHSLFASWSAATNPRLPDLRVDVMQRIEK